MPKRSKYLKPGERPVASLVRERLINGEKLDLSQVVRDYYKSNGEESLRRARSILTSVREKLETEEGRIMICRNGSYKLLDKNDRLQIDEARRRRGRAEAFVKTFSRNIETVRANSRKFDKQVKIEIKAFENYISRIR